jgi:hypothetical protein
MDTSDDDVAALKSFVAALAGQLSAISPEMANAVEQAALAASLGNIFSKSTVLQDIGIAIACAQHDAARIRRDDPAKPTDSGAPVQCRAE